MNKFSINIIKGILVKVGYKVVKVREPLKVKMNDESTWHWFKVYKGNNTNYEWYTWATLNILANNKGV